MTFARNCERCGMLWPLSFFGFWRRDCVLCRMAGPAFARATHNVYSEYVGITHDHT